MLFRSFISAEGRSLLAAAYASETIHPASRLILQAQLGHFVLHDQRVLDQLAQGGDALLARLS